KEHGLNNPDLLYNIGNTYFRLDNIPQAIIYYKRALLLDSSYKPAKENLNYAMSLTQDIQSIENNSFLNKFSTKIINTFSINTIFFFIVILLSIIIIFIHLQWIDSNRKISTLIDKAILRFINYVLIFILLLFLGLGITRINFVNNFNEAVIFDTISNVYSGPAESFTRLFTVHQGTIIKIHKEENEWSQISTLTGYNGWIKNNSYHKVKE
ncbi:MAG: SH3 domain-containing protein, partial [Candidatus Cloacimonetes bacterium]|nr:SH3 domain-containing protein [Candidatus Cloacimonadota bacterium]